jgi:hypothetical protein
MGQTHPQKSLFPMIVNTATENNMAVKTIGTALPAFININGLTIEQRGLGCIPIPLAKLPIGSVETTANVKKITNKEIKRKLWVTNDLINKTKPMRQNIALTQIRGSSKTSRKLILFAI